MDNKTVWIEEVTAVLAQRGYLKEKEFVNYLDYLQYWKQQQYAVYLKSVIVIICTH